MMLNAVPSTIGHIFSRVSKRDMIPYLLIMAVALVLRLWDLAPRAMHHDESLYASYAWYFAEGRGFQHDPLMHGPMMFHLTNLVFRALGDSEFTVRLLPALLGTGLVGAPYFMRMYLGKVGGVVVSIMLTVSPTLLYFSRFFREDIFALLPTVGVVICFWRYLEERKNRYLYLLVAFLAMLFATKEISFLLVAILAGFLIIPALVDVVPWLVGRVKLSQFSPPAGLLLLLVTLTLPLWSAFISVVQNQLGIVLANADHDSGPIGIPIGSGLYVATVVTVVLIIISFVIGLRWRFKTWLLCALIFYGIWLLLFTNGLTHPLGIATGIWQSLGYWVVQQDVARGNQPIYYYMVIGFNYEFLPFVFSLLAMGYYLRRGDVFSLFLIYWAVGTFILFTIAGEKMPWLLAHIVLPTIFLSGKFLGDLIGMVHWLKVIRQGGLVLLALVPVILVITLFLILLILSDQVVYSQWKFWVFLLIALLLGAIGVLFLRRLGSPDGLATVFLGLALILLPLSVFDAMRASYKNGDIPVEMLVYTQTSPDVVGILREIDRLALDAGHGKEIKITVDGTDGFAWPWVWYLRDYKHVSYPCLSNDPGCSPLSTSPDSDVLLLNARSVSTNQDYLEDFAPSHEFRHRWWFPETYRLLDVSKVSTGIVRKDGWRGMLYYFLYRDFGTPLGSIDARAYFPKAFESNFIQTKLP